MEPLGHKAVVVCLLMTVTVIRLYCIGAHGIASPTVGKYHVKAWDWRDKNKHKLPSRGQISQAFVPEKDVAYRRHSARDQSVSYIPDKSQSIEDIKLDTFPSHHVEDDSRQRALSNNTEKASPATSYGRVVNDIIGISEQEGERKETGNSVKRLNTQWFNLQVKEEDVVAREKRQASTTDFLERLGLGAMFPELDEYSSCSNACGRVSFSPCSCDVLCFIYKTCCEDIAEACPDLRLEAIDKLGVDLVERNDLMECTEKQQIYVVDRCPPGITVESLNGATNWRDTLKQIVLVTDPHTGIVFKNTTIYKCYKDNDDISSLKFWGLSLKIDYASFYDMAQILSTISDTKFTPPSEDYKGRKCSPEVVSGCAEDFIDLDPESLCGSFTSYVTDDMPAAKRTVYGNRYCYYCNTNQTDYIIDRRYNGVSGRSFRFSMLVDFQGDSEVSLFLNFHNTEGWKKRKCDTTSNKDMDSIPEDQTSSNVTAILQGVLSSDCSDTLCGEGLSMENGKCWSFVAVESFFYKPFTPFSVQELQMLTPMIQCFLTQRSHNIQTLQMKKFTCFDFSTQDFYAVNYPVHSVFGNVSGIPHFRFLCSFTVAVPYSRSRIQADMQDAVSYFYTTLREKEITGDKVLWMNNTYEDEPTSFQHSNQGTPLTTKRVSKSNEGFNKSRMVLGCTLIKGQIPTSISECSRFRVSLKRMNIIENSLAMCLGSKASSFISFCSPLLNNLVMGLTTLEVTRRVFSVFDR